MAVVSGISTNLTANEVSELLKAIDSREATQVPGSASVFAGSAGCEFDYQGSRYELEESYEVPIALNRVQPGAIPGMTSLLSIAEQMPQNPAMDDLRTTLKTMAKIK